MPNRWSDPDKPLEYLWNTTIFGDNVVQTPIDLFLWERFLNLTKPMGLLELGTGRGFLSLWLLMQSIQRGIYFISLDNDANPVSWTPNGIHQGHAKHSPLGILLGLDRHCVLLDIFAEERTVASMLEALPRPAVLWCDNGSKVKEFLTFVPYLQPGDYVVVHDFGSEFMPQDVAEHMVAPIDGFDALARYLGTFSLWRKRI